ncbi:type II toxin-antitoxin system PemK/MazF family toxin [Clostridium tyrobutyricum]|uniref:type II toxin-antitoxin system PemK/MazF family toxin n=1 Tax=Clostridium tyrobutyricum TaxID=1519 RepID=UPI00073D8BE8|nr:type II toxin-antitoxin system PemK/MazF family toxin [Clostridium tyrobutyricum]
MSIEGNVERGSIVWLNMHPTKGHEQNGWRSAIVLSDGLIDSNNSSFAIVVPITTKVKKYPFEVEVPAGIQTPNGRVKFDELEGVVLTDQFKSLDISARDGVVIGKVDETSDFYKTIITNVRSILA